MTGLIRRRLISCLFWYSGLCAIGLFGLSLMAGAMVFSSAMFNWFVQHMPLLMRTVPALAVSAFVCFGLAAYLYNCSENKKS